MGRGLAAILLSPAELGGGEHERELRQIPLELIEPNPRQPRRQFDEDALVALAESVARARRPAARAGAPRATGGTYELIAGERRWRAARLAGLESVPALVRDARRRASRSSSR